AIDWDERNGTEAAPKLDAPDHFFSKKSWSQVFGVTDMGARLAQRLNLPRPSRVQNMTFYDVQEGLNVLIADQSGSGKTLAYMLPLFQRYVLGQPEDEEHLLKLVVLVPTSDLAEQTVAVAKSAAVNCGWDDFRVHSITGGQPATIQRRLLKNGVDMIVATAGRLRWLMLE
ncbi:unnamed protein product, partial [Polarella glacialis]